MATVVHATTGLGTEVTVPIWEEAHTVSGMTVGYTKLFFYEHAGKDYTPGDTNYHEIEETEAKVANDYITPAYARIVARVDADEAGTKALKINDVNADVCEVEWDGAAAITIVGDWTAYTDIVDRVMSVYYKASSNTETVTIINVALEMR